MMQQKKKGTCKYCHEKVHKDASIPNGTFRLATCPNKLMRNKIVKLSKILNGF